MQQTRPRFGYLSIAAVTNTGLRGEVNVDLDGMELPAGELRPVAQDAVQLPSGWRATASDPAQAWVDRRPD